MVYRLPSHLESLVPVQNLEGPTTSNAPWRGDIWVKGMRQDRNHADQIEVTGVEADGDRMAHWPTSFHAQVYNGPILHEFKAWMAHRPEIPVCTLLPLRKPDADENTINLAQFRTLSCILAERNTIATATWAPDTHLPACTLVLYPTTNSSAVLVGAVLFSDIPPFINLSYTPITHRGETVSYPLSRRNFNPAAYVLSSPHHAPSLSPHHNSSSNSPIEQPIAMHNRHDATYYQMLARQGQSYSTYPQQNPPY